MNARVSALVLALVVSGAPLPVLGQDSTCLLSLCDTSTESSTPTEPEPTWHDEYAPPPKPANRPASDDLVAFETRAAADWAYSQGRGIDQQTHPEYLAITAPWLADYYASQQTDPAQPDLTIEHDPYRIDWHVDRPGHPRRGELVSVEIPNRYGAILKAQLFLPLRPSIDPVTGQSSDGPFPAVVFMPGGCCNGRDTIDDPVGYYAAVIQQLAESGYVVLLVSPQGQGGSQYFEDGDPICSESWWKEPQEMELKELGPCPGRDASAPPMSSDLGLAPLYALDPTGLSSAFLTLRLEPHTYFDWLAAVYDAWRPRFVFAALDATTWLLSSDNPYRELVDEHRLAIAGHSLGGDAALLVGNGDPQHRFRAAVSFDSYGVPPKTVSPTVPTMIQQAELQIGSGAMWDPGSSVLGPDSPQIEIRAPWRNAQRFQREGVDTMLVALRGSSHGEWMYRPYALVTNTIVNSSSKGPQVAQYYALAWLDRWLKGAPANTAQGPKVQIDDARRRLLACDFDGSVDRTSIGQGKWDPLTLANAPYQIAGERVAEHLSVWFPSQIAFDGYSESDLQYRCGLP